MIIGLTTTNTWLLIVLIIILVVWLCYRLYQSYQVSKVAKYLTNDEFKQGIRKAQVIDLREKKNFDAGHILGARNMPYSTLRTYYQQIRADLPVYLYDQGRTVSKQAVLFLHKKGYQKLFILKTGYQNWDGKEKKTK